MNTAVRILGALALVGAVTLAVADDSTPVVYTNADLLRLFGAAALAPATPAPPASPDADWALVDGVLQREEERIEAERQHELERLRAAAPEPEPAWAYPVAWRLGFPASLWWQRVWCAYSGSEGTPGTPGLVAPCPSREPERGFYRPN